MSSETQFCFFGASHGNETSPLILKRFFEFTGKLRADFISQYFLLRTFSNFEIGLDAKNMDIQYNIRLTVIDNGINNISEYMVDVYLIINWCTINYNYNDYCHDCIIKGYQLQLILYLHFARNCANLNSTFLLNCYFISIKIH